MAKSRHASLRSLQRYARPGAEAVAALTAATDPPAGVAERNGVQMPVPTFSEQHLEAIAKLLGALLTGSEITRMLQQAEIYKDVIPDDTKC